ncbi:MAG: RIO1 family regulatory kinase/ATPase [Caldilineales bacterium]
MNLSAYDDHDDFGHYLPQDRRTHRQARTARRPAATRPKPTLPHEIIEQLDGDDDLTTTLVVGESEQRLLQAALTDFYRDNVISDVLARVKGGKEANVYCCRAHPSTGMELIAAKIYRPQAHRTLRNDAIYKEGRLLLDEEGKGVVRNTRLKRAIAQKTDFGREAATFSWIEHEYAMLRALHAAGADVPRPIGHLGNTILMEYFGEVNQPAPTLSSARLESNEAQPLFERLLWHVELMLRQNRVHGDLSAYNVLYWQGRAVVIDFPQAVIALRNPHALRLLQRDIERLTQYFAPYGVKLNAAAHTQALWERFQNDDL